VRSRTLTIRMVLAANLVASLQASGQTRTAVRPEPRPLRPVTTASPVSFSRVAQVRRLSDGRVLVNDVGQRRVLLLDSALAFIAVVLDSTAGATNGYGVGPNMLIPFTGDSSLILDRGSRSGLVVSPGGKIARVMALPAGNALLSMTSGASGDPAYSDAFGLLYYAPLARPQARPTASRPEVRNVIGDSAMILGMNMVTRKIDTIAYLATGRGSPTFLSLDPSGKVSTKPDRKAMVRAAMFPVFDDWAMTADGSLAILHSGEYRIDWLAAGVARSSVRMPYPWQPIDDLAKQRLADSLAAEQRAGYETTRAASLRDSANRAARGTVNPAIAASKAAAQRLIVAANAAGVEVSADALRLAGGGMPAPEQPIVLDPADIPDFALAFQRVAAVLLSDRDNNLWVRPKAIPDTANVYDIVSRAGQIVDRVVVPAGSAIVGFGSGGLVFLTSGAARQLRLQVWTR
jgi:hypothetical protein